MVAPLRSAFLLSGLLLAALLSGCSGGEVSNGPDGQSANGQGSVAYNGASSGTQTSEPFDCDGSGQVSVSGNLGSGSVTFTVMDGGGTHETVYSKTLSGPGQIADGKDISGTAGQWRIRASRATGFTGQYAANVSC